MNTICFSVYKNTLKKTDGFNPVSSENKYSEIKLNFRGGDDWEKCSVVSATFFCGLSDETHSDVVEINNLSAAIKIPSAVLKNKSKVQFGISGVFDNDGTAVTISTNVVTINLNKGIIVNDSIGADIYERLMTIFNEKISAKLLCNTPQMFGAIGNGIADDTNAIQRAVDLGLPVYIPKGTYKITKPILAKDMYIDGDTQAIIKSYCNDKAAFELNVESPNLGYISRNSYIRNITINVNNGKYGIHYNRTHNLSLKNIKIKNFSVAGILAGSLTDGVKSYNIETVASGLVLFNESAILGSVGIRNLTTDSYWKDIIVYNTDVGIEPGGNDIVTCHYWNSLEELTETCTAFVLRDKVNATLSSCCSDSSRYAVRLGDYSRATINGLRIIYAAAMIEKYAKVSDCVIIDSAEDPANPSKYYSSCTAHITGLEIKAQTSVNLKILSDYLFNRYKTLPTYWRNISISSSFIAPNIANQPSLGFENFSNTQGTRNRDGVGGISDCNTREIGVYRCTTSTANIPETAKGMLICLSSGEYNWSQIYITSSALWIRYSSSATTWDSWVKINQS